MNMLGIVGSMRKTGSTDRLVRIALDAAKEANPAIEGKILQISDLRIEPCAACYDLCSQEPYKCAIEDDLQAVLAEMKRAHAIVIGSPLYFRIPARLTALLERLVCLSFYCEIRGFTDPHPLNDIPCGLISITGGGEPREVLEQLFNFTLSLKMKPITMKTYPYFGVGGKGLIDEDKELSPIENARELGRLLAAAALAGASERRP
jgi:multimeric flavodoxin WrbA